MPFPPKKAAPFPPKKGGGKAGPPFEKSRKDVEPRGMKEGTPREEAFDRKQMGGKGFKKGGKVGCC